MYEGILTATSSLTLAITSKGSVTNEGFKINVNNFALKVEDTSLFVANEDYQIEFALALEENNQYSNLTILDIDKLSSKTYNGESRFELSQNVTLNSSSR